MLFCYDPTCRYMHRLRKQRHDVYRYNVYLLNIYLNKKNIIVRYRMASGVTILLNTDSLD